MSDRFFYLQLKFTPKIGHTFTDEREVAVEVPKNLVKHKSDLINESLKEVIALGLLGAKSAALSTFPTEARAVDLYEALRPRREWHKGVENLLETPAFANSPLRDFS
jgi:hypothetical protein